MPARKKDNAPRRDIHAEITNKLIAAIEANPGTPVMPWRRSAGPLFMPVNALTGNAYSGINVVSLWVSAEAQSYATPIWATYRQWSELGCQVRKGEKSSLVVFYKEYDSEPDPDIADDNGKRRVARASCVFNASQVDGFTAPAAPQPLGPVERLQAVDAFIAATGARIEHGGERAFYRPSTDHIQMPDEGLFCGTDTMSRGEAYYAVLAHELTHWSGASIRLGRDMGKRFGDAAYAAEELVAEIASAFLCAELGITQDTRADHAQYLAHWLKLLKDDSRAIFTAAAKASEAVAYLKGLQPPG
jgi:antirestriction protein ArdC